MNKDLKNFFGDIIGSIIISSLGIFLIFGIFVYPLSFYIVENCTEESLPFIITIMIIIVLATLYSVYTVIGEKLLEEKNEYKNCKTNLENKCKMVLDNYKKEYAKLMKVYNHNRDLLFHEKEMFEYMMNDEKIYKPYLAKIISDYQYHIDEIRAKNLINKKRPAVKAADELKEIAKEKRELLKRLKITEYQLSVYEGLFPELKKYKEASQEEVEKYINDTSDEEEIIRKYLSIEEYNNLSIREKYQLSLDRYRNNSKKSKWQVGIDFERYVGYLYEIEGYKVVYNGANLGLEDLGRDLIAQKDNELLIVQCKYWKKEKTIHEKHIFQLFGTTLLKQMEVENNKDKTGQLSLFDIEDITKLKVKGVFICTNKVSDIAKKIAEKLDIEVLDNFYFDKDYPCIKCNISKKDNSKIYHLPFDQQYDRVDIEVNRGETYVSTIEEAEKLGFRKAMKHMYHDKD